MDKQIRNLFLYFMAILLVAMTSCNEDALDHNTTEFDYYEPEQFDDLTIETLSQIETPFESLINTIASGGRVAGDIDIDGITAALLEILSGAKKIEISEVESRGLASYKIELLLASGGKLKVTVVKELFKILKIEGASGPFDYNIDPQGNFISLSEAMHLAADSLQGEVVRWELELEEDNQWEYEIHVKTNDNKYEVEIDAFTGTIIDINLMDGEHKEDEEDGDDQAPVAIIEAVQGFITGEIIRTSKEEEDGQVFWKVYVKTESGALVKLIVSEDNMDLNYAKGEEGPFDYNLTPGADFFTLEEAVQMAQENFEGELYYWYYEEVWHDEASTWAYVIKLYDGQGHYSKIGIDASTGTILFQENHQEEHDEVPANVLEAAGRYIEGEVIHGARHEEESHILWKLEVQTASGAVVRMTITEDTEDLIYAKDEEGPFDYNLTPGDGFISLADAIGIAKEAFEGEVYYWYFESIDHEDTHPFAYVVKLRNGQEQYYKFGIDATTGNILFEEAFE